MLREKQKRRARRWATLCGATIVALSAAAQVPAAATHSYYVTGLKTEYASVSSTSRFDAKTATAVCGEGKQVLGGGGYVIGERDDYPEWVKLTRLEPTTKAKYVNGTYRHGYRVTGAPTGTGTGTWHVRAFAICADPVPGHRIERKVTDRSTAPRQSIEAVCPNGQRALGAGAKTNRTWSSQIGLQVARASGTGDITRAQAHASDGLGGRWSVTAFAVCAKAPIGNAVRYGESTQGPLEPVKRADAECTSGKRLIGAGAAVTSTAPGNVALQAASPYGSENKVWAASAVENTATPRESDFMVAQAICASRPVVPPEDNRF